MLDVKSNFEPAAFTINVDNEENFTMFFDGPVPVVGDRVELICSHATDKSISLKWRVIKTE